MFVVYIISMFATKTRQQGFQILCAASVERINSLRCVVRYQSSVYLLPVTRFCVVWASHGMCEVKKVYMSMNCRAACGMCRSEEVKVTSESACRDYHDECGTWATYNVCLLKQEYMNTYCKKSCGKSPARLLIDELIHG